MHILINKKYITFGKFKAKCSIGKGGISNKRKEGDLITPKGRYKIKFILYRKDRIKKVQSKIKRIVIKKDMGWCDDPRSRKYNQLIKLPSIYKHEKLYRKDNTYDIILVLNFNMNPIIKNKGSAIFIHVARRDYKKTKGCIALKKTNLLKIVKDLTKRTTIKIVNQK